MKLATNTQTLMLLLNGMSPHVRRHCIRKPTLLELIPYLFLVTSPNLRPVCKVGQNGKNTKLEDT